MTDSELNKWLHENVIGEHWHDSRPSDGARIHGDWLACTICEMWWGPNLDYCNSLDAVAKVEARVIELLGMRAYYDALTNQVVMSADWEESLASDGHIATATARQRADACKETWESK